MRRKDREIKEIHEIESIISRSDVCRVAFANDNVPYIVTMNFGYTGGNQPSFYFHCAAEGRKLDMIRKNNFVCFELDTDHEIYTGELGCDWGMKYSSVVGYGKIFLVKETDSKIKGLNNIMAHYSHKKDFSFDSEILDRTLIMKLIIEEMTGKRK